RKGRGLLRGHRTAHLPPVADVAVARGGEPAPLALVVLERPRVQLGRGQPAPARDGPAELLRPREAVAGDPVGDVVGQTRVDGDPDDDPPPGPVVAADPGPGRAVRVAEHEVVAPDRAAAGHLGGDHLAVGAGPPPGLPLVPAQQGDQLGHVTRPRLVHGPPLGQGGSGPVRGIGHTLGPAAVSGRTPRAAASPAPPRAPWWTRWPARPTPDGRRTAAAGSRRARRAARAG